MLACMTQATSTPADQLMTARDLQRIEVLDEAMAAVFRRKTPAERLAIGFGLWRAARALLRGQLASLHPEWEAARLDREVARRLSHGAV
jgi:hypothetical protein